MWSGEVRHLRTPSYWCKACNYDSWGLTELLQSHHIKTHKQWSLLRHLSKVDAVTRNSPDWALNNSMSYFFSSSKRTRGAIDESGWIFNGSESLGQARAWDDKLWGIKQRREWGKEVTQWGVVQTEGVQEFRYRQRRIDSLHICKLPELLLSLKCLTGHIAVPAP